MRTIFYLLGILTLVYSCDNPKTRSVEELLSIEEVVIVKEKLDSNLVRGVLNLVQTGDHLKYPEIELNESFIAMGFLAIPDNPPLDSMVLITYFHNTFAPDDSKNNYRGMLNIEGYNVAIFDMGNFGNKYYSIDSLRQIPPDTFKRYPMKTIFMEQYYVLDGILKYAGPAISPDPDLYKVGTIIFPRTATNANIKLDRTTRDRF